MANLAIDKAYLIALWLEAVFYGINIVLFWACLVVLTQNKRRSEINKILVAVAIAQYLLSSADLSLALQRLLTGFIRLHDQHGEPATYFSTVSDYVGVARVLIITINSIVADGILAWRCYLVWDRSWKAAALPIALVVATAVCGIGQVLSFARSHVGASVSSSQITLWNGFMYGISLAASIVSTGFIAFRSRTLLRTSSPGPTAYGRFLTMGIESGMVHSTVLTIGIVLYALGCDAFYIVYEQIGQLSSITSTMILLLVGLGMSSHDIHSRCSKNVLSTLAFQNRRATASHNMPGPVEIVEIISAANYNAEYDLKVIPPRRDERRMYAV